MPTAAVYIRQTELGPSPDQQRMECMLEIEGKGWACGPEFLDREGFDGRPGPDYHMMLASLRGRKVDFLVAHSAERMFRTLEAIDSIFRASRAGNVGIVLCKERINTAGAHGAFLIQATAIVTEIVHRRRSEVISIGQQRRLRRGMPLGRIPKKTPELDQIIDGMLESGKSECAIARELGVSRFKVRRRHKIMKEPACSP